MSEELKKEVESVGSGEQDDIVVLVKKMQQQLVYLEKKIDTLIGQLQEKSSQERSFREKRFDRPFRSFDRPQGHYRDKRDSGEGPRERSFRPGQHFDKRRSDEDRGFSGPRREYGGEREGGSSQDRPFKKKFGGEKRGFGARKKPFFHGRRDRE